MARTKAMEHEQCIYCRTTKTLDQFSREHVLPRAFGTYKHNFVLNEHQVCKECNQYFGDNLERDMARDTFEGLQRLVLDPKQAHKAVKFRDEGVTLTLIEPPELKGARLRLTTPDDEGVRVTPRTQIGVFSKGAEDRVFLLEEEIETAEVLDDANRDSTREMVILIEHAEDKQRIVAALAKRGVPFNETREESAGLEARMPVEVQAVVSQFVFRTVAKIALNYLTYTLRKPTALNPAFDGVRWFVRYGLGSPMDFVQISDRRIMKGDDGTQPTILGHFVTLTRNQAQLWQAVLGW